MPGYSYFLQLSREGGEPPAANIFVYNNTFYKPNAGSVGSDGYTLVDLPDTSISNVTIRNNLGYAPLATGSVMYNDLGITGLTQSNNSTSSQINSASPLFSGATNPVDFTPGSGSYVVGAGAAVPVWSDFLGNRRPQGAFDIGAVEVP